MTVGERRSSSCTSNFTTNGNIWLSILRSVASSKIVPTKNILVLGDPSSGKSTLIQHLQQPTSTFPSPRASAKTGDSLLLSQQKVRQDSRDHTSKKQHLALGYEYTDVQDEDNEVTARLGIYQLSSPAYVDLLRYVLTAEKLKDTMVLIVLDWSQPWHFVSKLQQWFHVIQQAILTLIQQHPDGKDLVETLGNNIRWYMQHYLEPTVITNEKSSRMSTLVNADQVVIPLTEGTLTTNYGVPIAVVCCKSDTQTTIQKAYNYKEDHFDYIQQVLRTICLRYGAALFYTTTSHPHTFSSLRQYILHRTLPQASAVLSPSSYEAMADKVQTLDRETVMIPAGWDSWGKIKALQGDFDCHGVDERWNMDLDTLTERQLAPLHGLQSQYSEITKAPEFGITEQPSTVSSVIICEDEQTVLQRHFDSLQRSGGCTSQTVAKLPTSTSLIVEKSGDYHHRPGLVGPLGSSSTSTLDILHATTGRSPPPMEPSSLEKTAMKDTERLTKKLAMDKLNRGSTVPLTTSASDTLMSNSVSSSTASSDNSTTHNTSNEVLTNFFQSLLSKKSISTSTSTSSTSSCSRGTSVNSVKKDDLFSPPTSSSSSTSTSTFYADEITNSAIRRPATIDRNEMQKQLTRIRQQQHLKQ